MTLLQRRLDAGQIEVRYFPTSLSVVELRSNEEAGTVEFTGYATVYDVWYDVAGGPPYGWREMVVAGAGRRTLNARPDVRLLVNHDGLPLARTRSGTLLLEEHDQGLYANAPALDLRNPTVQEVRSAMDRKDVDEMSYAFRVTRQEWNEDYTERRIIEYGLDVDGSDVSVVTYPANKATVAQLRNAAKIEELRQAVRPVGLPASTARAVVEQLRLKR